MFSCRTMEMSGKLGGVVTLGGVMGLSEKARSVVGEPEICDVHLEGGGEHHRLS